MNSASAYAVRVWLTAVIIAPIFIVAFSFIPNSNFGDALLITLVVMVIGFVFSLPSALLLGLATQFIIESRIENQVNQKIVLSFISLLLTLLALFLPGIAFGIDAVYWGLVYVVIIVGSIWFYKLEPVGDITLADAKDRH